jgi:hypothetical protein
MTGDTRIPTTKATIRGLFTAARMLNQETKFTVRSFTGPQWENVPTQLDMDSVLNAMVFNTGESLPGPLNARVTTPMLAAASTRVLKPTIVVMITDGDVSSLSPVESGRSSTHVLTATCLHSLQIGSLDDFRNAITSFKSTLDGSGFAGPVVILLVCRVGTDPDAEKSLMSLKTDPSIANWLYYNENSLDQRIATMTDEAFVGTVSHSLPGAMEAVTYHMIGHGRCCQSYRAPGVSA